MGYKWLEQNEQYHRIKKNPKVWYGKILKDENIIE